MNLFDDPSWNSFARTNASERFRKQSAVMGTPLTELIVREAHIAPELCVLDVACGTGEPAISIATQLSGTGQVIAIDISPEALAIAEQRARQRALGNIQFREADAHSLPFEAEHFDRVTSRLGLMFMADLPKALSEMGRVLKPKGKFAAVAWGPIQQPYFETTIGTVQKLLPELQLPGSGLAMCKFGDTSVLALALKEAGFAESKAELRDVEWTWQGTAEEAWEYFQAVTIPFAGYLKSIPADRKTDVDRAVIEAIHRYSKDGQIYFGAKFILATARR